MKENKIAGMYFPRKGLGYMPSFSKPFKGDELEHPIPITFLQSKGDGGELIEEKRGEARINKEDRN